MVAYIALLDAERLTVIFFEFIIEPENLFSLERKNFDLSQYIKHLRFEINSTITNATFLIHQKCLI